MKTDEGAMGRLGRGTFQLISSVSISHRLDDKVCVCGGGASGGSSTSIPHKCGIAEDLMSASNSLNPVTSPLRTSMWCVCVREPGARLVFKY